MLKSTLQLVQSLSDALLRIPAIVRGFEQRSPQALPQLMQWADEAERLLSSHRMTAAAQIAGLKARVLAAEYDDARRGAARRRQLGVAIGQVHDMQQAMQDALHPHAAKVQQCRDLVRHLLQVVAQSGVIKYDPGAGFEMLVAQVWALCSGHDQLKPHAAQLKSLLSQDDIKLLLAAEIDPRDFVTDEGSIGYSAR